MKAWENNPNGICEDAPCCGCCGPQGDGAYYPDEPPDPDSFYDDSDDPDPGETCADCGRSLSNSEYGLCGRCEAHAFGE